MTWDTCATPFCFGVATDSFKALKPDGVTTIEYLLCREHAKKLAREFDKAGRKYSTGPITYG